VSEQQMTMMHIPMNPATDAGTNSPPIGAKRRWSIIISPCAYHESSLIVKSLLHHRMDEFRSKSYSKYFEYLRSKALDTGLEMWFIYCTSIVNMKLMSYEYKKTIV